MQIRLWDESTLTSLHGACTNPYPHTFQWLQVLRCKYWQVLGMYSFGESTDDKYLIEPEANKRRGFQRWLGETFLHFLTSAFLPHLMD